MSELAPAFNQQYFDDNGDPLSGGKLYTYVAGTVTPLASYTAQDGITQNTNPIILDAGGRCNLYLSTGTYYKIVTTDADDVVIETRDDIMIPAASGTAQGNSIHNQAGGGTIALVPTDDNIQVITGTGATTVESMEAPSGGPKKIVIHNDTDSVITVRHENGGSSAINRFTLPGAQDLLLEPQVSVEFFYDTADDRWKQIAQPLLVGTLTASRALVTSATRGVTASSVTATELGYVSGVTSAIQTQLNTKISDLTSFDSDDLPEGATNKYFTDEKAQDAVGAMVDSTLEYTDATPLLSRAALTGDVTAAAGSNATTIANDAVTFAKMQNIATDKLIGRDTASSGDPEEISVGGGLEFTGSSGIQT
jgi:hypothetical protein